jgi:glutathione S-transferase
MYTKNRIACRNNGEIEMTTATQPNEDAPLIYGSPISSFTRKVLLALQFKGIAHRCELPDMDLFKQLNPLGKMPVLLTEGRTIIDSSVICDFLDRRYPDAPKLYPVDAFQRAQALWLEEYIDTTLQESCYALVNEVLFKPLRYGQPSDPKVVEESKGPIGDRLDYLEQELSGPSFVEGGIGIAELTLFAVTANPISAGFVIDPACWPSLAQMIAQMDDSDLIVNHTARYGQSLKPPTDG